MYFDEWKKSDIETVDVVCPNCQFPFQLSFNSYKVVDGSSFIGNGKCDNCRKIIGISCSFVVNDKGATPSLTYTYPAVYLSPKIVIKKNNG